MKKFLLYLLIAIAFISLDIFARFLFSQTWFGEFNFNKDLEPFDIIALVVTSLLTIWLGIYISKRLTEQRYEKEYIINDVKAIEAEVNYIQKDILSSATIDIDRLLRHVNGLANSIAKFKKTLEIFDTECLKVTELDLKFRTLYTNTTNLSGSSLVINTTNRNQLDTYCNNLILSTRSIVKEINSK